MNKYIKLQYASILFLISTLSACDYRHKEEVVGSGTGKSDYMLGNSSTFFKGVRTKDESLKAITIPCQDNNTFRLYYSDSVITRGMPDTFTVVSYGKRIRLAHNECCIEVTSSVGDTWLSTGSGKPKVVGGTGTVASRVHDKIWLQHFTSTPQSDSTTVTFNLIPE